MFLTNITICYSFGIYNGTRRCSNLFGLSHDFLSTIQYILSKRHVCIPRHSFKKSALNRFMCLRKRFQGFSETVIQTNQISIRVSGLVYTNFTSAQRYEKRRRKKMLLMRILVAKLLGVAVRLDYIILFIILGGDLGVVSMVEVWTPTLCSTYLCLAWGGRHTTYKIQVHLMLTTCIVKHCWTKLS